VCGGEVVLNVDSRRDLLGRTGEWMTAGLREVSRLVRVRLPGGVTALGNGAFSGAAHLRIVVIGAGCKVLGKGAFKVCMALEKVGLGRLRDDR
jgi:hypothetical protein